ncbi:MAG: voltage-gated potassium channel protein [Acidiferrobacterales bacterium]
MTAGVVRVRIGLRSFSDPLEPQALPILPTDLLRPRLHQRVHQLFDRWRHKSRWEFWFPHVPLALATGLLGFAILLPAVRHVLLLRKAGGAMGLRSLLLDLNVLHNLPQGIAGAIMLVMAAGLLLRSRLAWVTTLLIALATLAMEWHGPALHSRALIIFNGATLLALLLSHRHFGRSSLAAGSMFAAISVLMLLGYAIFGAYTLGSGFAPPITNLPTALYFAVETMSTVGFGDIVPASLDARLFTVSVIILGITVFATSVSAIIVPAVNGRMQELLEGGKKLMSRKNHYVIVGNTPLARNTYRELKTRQLPVTVIVSQPPTAADFADADVVVGEGSDVETLHQAGSSAAIAVLALRDDDSENAFTILAVKEAGGNPRTVAAVNHGKNMARVRSVRPDMIIAPQVMGGEILAMALNGEELDRETIIDRLFSVSDKGQARP